MRHQSGCFLIPVIGDQRILERTWDSVVSQARDFDEVLVYADGRLEREYPHAFTYVRQDWRNVAQMLNHALWEVGDRIVVVLPPDVVPDPDCLASFCQALGEHRGAGGAYSDYRMSDGREIRLLDDPGDITERQDWGRVMAVRADMIRRKGGVDEGNPEAAFYDLRLKLTDDCPMVHVSRVLYEVPPPELPKEDVGKDVLFFPGQGQYGGFSYLFSHPAEERQIEQVFYRMLRRRGAFLDQIPEVTPLDTGPLPSPAVSVLIPVYNRQDYIAGAIESVLRGTFEDFELLVIDNGSADGTCAEVERYSGDQRVRLLHCPENIIAKSLNTGIKAARGRYVAQLDSDDEYTPDTLSVMVEYLENHPTTGLAISYYELMDAQGNTLKEFGVIKHEEYNRNNILRVDGAGAVRVWRRSVLKELGGFDERELGGYGEDYDLVLKVSERYQVGRVHQVLYRYRRHPGNTDALIDPYRKICAKSLARQNALRRRQELNRNMQEKC
jgi:GT2 family glycosyltransferase